MVKYQLEYPIKSSVKILYDALTDASKLSEWFCDNVNLIDGGKVYEFFWDGSSQRAEVVTVKEGKKIKFHWEEEDDDTYFELKIQIDDITNDVALVVTDFAEEGEEDEAKLLWDSQVRDLFQALGA